MSVPVELWWIRMEFSSIYKINSQHGGMAVHSKPCLYMYMQCWHTYKRFWSHYHHLDSFWTLHQRKLLVPITCCGKGTWGISLALIHYDRRVVSDEDGYASSTFWNPTLFCPRTRQSKQETARLEWLWPIYHALTPPNIYYWDYITEISNSTSSKKFAQLF